MKSDYLQIASILWVTVVLIGALIYRRKKDRRLPVGSKKSDEI